MTSTESTQELVYKKFRAPRENGSSLIDPSISSASELLRDTFAADASVRDDGASEDRNDFCGKSLSETRSFARNELYHIAKEYTARLLDLMGLDAELPLVENVADHPVLLSGHQPELFHPGVWFKNFVLDQISRTSDLRPIAINFLVDNDVCRTTSIQVPTRTASGEIHTQDVSFDVASMEVPWEMRRIVDSEVFESFCARVANSLPADIDSPTIKVLWPEVRKAVANGLPLGKAIAAARLTLEWRSNVTNLEVPLSDIAGTRSFARFSIQLLSQLPRFQQVYNDRLGDYRRAHKIRNHAHPVPALEEVGTWLEAPFWVYRDAAPERKRLWVRIQGDHLQLSDLEGWQESISGRLDCDNAATQWLGLAEKGVLLRPRALTTTMFTRVFIGDLFIHGIGGAKYDQLTDSIISDFYGIPAPPVMVASATLHLPLGEHSEATGSEVEQQKQRIWQLRHNPETMLGDSAEIAGLVVKKKELLAEVPPQGEKWQWHIDLKAVKDRLQEIAAPAIEQAKIELEDLELSLRQQKTLGSREYSFCLFPFEATIESLRDLVSP